MKSRSLGAGRRRADLTVVVPTRDEALNVEPLLDRLVPALEGLRAEVLFVDDSDDATPEAVLSAAERLSPFPVRLLHRSPSERSGGLGGAVVAGFSAAAGSWVVVMDGDLQHPPELVPLLYSAGTTSGATVVVASRYSPEGSATGLSGRRRRFASTWTGRLAQLLFPSALSGITDPMSGFFALDRSRVPLSSLHPEGFKILLELVVRLRPIAVEVPFVFAPRHAGDSKASLREGVRFVRHLLRLYVASRRA